MRARPCVTVALGCALLAIAACAKRNEGASAPGPGDGAAAPEGAAGGTAARPRRDGGATGAGARRRVVEASPGSGPLVGPPYDGGFYAHDFIAHRPADPHIAVGPDHVVAVAHDSIGFYDRSGALLWSGAFDASSDFWSTCYFDDPCVNGDEVVGPCNVSSIVYDPEVVFDRRSGRFLVLASDDFLQTMAGASPRSYLLLAVSDDANPLGAWHRYRIETTCEVADMFDSTNLAADENAIYIGGTKIDQPRKYVVYALDKASLLRGDPPATMTVTAFPPPLQFPGMPPVTTGAPALYSIAHDESSNPTNRLQLFALRDALGTPQLTGPFVLAVPAYFDPGQVPHKGGFTSFQLWEPRFWSVAYRDGSLWAAHHAGRSLGAGCVVRWYEIAMNGWPDKGTPALVQSGVIDPSESSNAKVHAYFPGIAVDDYGNVAVAYIRSATREFISMATSYRYASDPPGTMRSSVARKASAVPCDCLTSCLVWGDYTTVTVDPSDGRSMWAHGMLMNPDPDASDCPWRTWVHAFTPAFCPGDVDFDGVVGAADVGLIGQNQGPCTGSCPWDLNGDRIVDQADLDIAFANFGATAPDC